MVKYCVIFFYAKILALQQSLIDIIWRILRILGGIENALIKISTSCCFCVSISTCSQLSVHKIWFNMCHNFVATRNDFGFTFLSNYYSVCPIFSHEQALIMSLIHTKNLRRRCNYRKMIYEIWSIGSKLLPILDWYRRYYNMLKNLSDRTFDTCVNIMFEACL